MYIYIYIHTGSTSRMEHFVFIVNGFQSLTTNPKSSILDVAAVLDLPLLLYKNSHLFICCTKTHTYLKVFFKKREVLFKINFLKVLQTIIICIKFRQNS